MEIFEIDVYTPDGVCKKFEAEFLLIHNSDFLLGITKNHTPLISDVKISKMTYKLNGEEFDFAISNGLLKFNNGLATIVVDAIESKDEIDINRAKESKIRAENRLKERQDNVDILRAELSLQRALNRLSIVEGKN